jgi:hypothetical protein
MGLQAEPSAAPADMDPDRTLGLLKALLKK